ncbi:MAG: glycosyltransferase [Clostridium sp.]|nr:glycosyltransferase [Clostridium sp.]
MSDGLISVIIPVYNVEKYIERCLDSVVSQTYTNLEIILVDDGSTDSSGDICDHYKQKDRRIHVIHKRNGGLSSARNVGLRAAAGDYIAFVDSDDFVHPTMYERMLERLVETDSDMVVSEICKIDKGELEDFRFPSNEHLQGGYTCLEGRDVFIRLSDEDDIATVVQWNKLYKNSVMRGIEYPDGRVHEDVYVIHKELYNCSKVTYMDTALYYYVQRKNSIMHMETRRMIQDAIDGYLDRIEFMKEKSLDREYNCAASKLLSYLHWKFVSISISEGYTDTCQWIGESFKHYARDYGEILKDCEGYRRLNRNPQKYCRYMIYTDKKAKFVGVLLRKLKKGKEMLCLKKKMIGML